ncbi:Lipin [Macleaya cordata]|uniref:phosphatidate phosphatase n=1 Tax=Macleaya cordata TaxID=56857 RepID=A0A200QZF9_MACCD|nr:Lipin [Macleaya cordata]
MYAVARLISRGVYTVSGPFHPFGGAVDIIVVQQPDGSFKSSPWYVRFGKFQGVLKTKEKVVSINVNGVEADFHMYLDHKGEAYFLSDVVGEEEEEGDLVFASPSSGEETDEQLQSETSIESKSSNFDATKKNSSDRNIMGDGKIVTRTNSRRSKILGLVFGRKSMNKENGSGEGNVERWDSLERAEIAADLLEVKWSTNLPTDEVTNPNFNCSRTKEQDLEVSAMETTQTSDVAETQKETSATSAGLQNPGDVTKMVSISGSLVLDLQNSDLAEIEVKPSSQSVIELASNESNGLLVDGVHEEEIRKERVSSYIYCETSESSPVGVENLGEEAIVTLSLSNGESEKSQVGAGVQYEATELISEVSSQPESGALVIKENIGDIGVLSDENSCEISKSEADSGKNGSSMYSFPESIKMELDSLVDVQMVTSGSIEAKNLQVMQLKTVTERLNERKKLESEPVEVCENQSMITKFSHSIHQDQQVGSFGEESKMNKHHSSLESIVYPRGPEMEVANSSIPLSESSEEEDQFLFSDIDHLTSSTVHCKEFIPPDSMGTEDHHLASLDDISNEHDSNEINHDSPSSSDNLVQECPPVTSQALLEESRTTSSPLSIPSGRKGPLEEVERMMESLPIIRSHIDNLEISDVLHPLCCSLDSSSRSLRWELFRKEGSIPCKSDPDSDKDFLKEHLRISDTCNPEELKRMLIIPAIEISLCKHLLYEGMGVDAASQAFDAEKVDLEKFVSLASSPLKNDRLVVKIGGRYFPWDAAVPIISGMASFGHEQNFVPEGMIAVDRVEETLEGLSPRTIVTSGGSWRLWPFRRSKTIGSVHPRLDGIGGSDADDASENSRYLSPDKNVHKIKVTEKKVKSIIPTSEQLASLNLKEGRNMITFTFSTAMLGKQQVDARIYLLKWNTRIVVSDVDGTITKSDVLGQFMPLVGKDWSQTGVAHLFSAIEENGYKFLYLSARSVSQAYLTRQFLINLKQDGKALPDGPVVISPDGLFPSLFREVIRRAPHEFKIACLEDIKALFPPDCNPFYAGFGNRDTDELSYLKVGIPKGKIFTINPKGEVVVNRRVDSKSYTSLHALVNGMFPAMTSAGQEEFNSWNFWKVPLPHLDI